MRPEDTELVNGEASDASDTPRTDKAAYTVMSVGAEGDPSYNAHEAADIEVCRQLERELSAARAALAAAPAAPVAEDADITQMIHDAGGDMEKVHAILAAQPDTVCVPRTVWQVSSKTAILLFSTEADADVFIASHPPSVSGGMFKKEVPVHYAAGGKR